MRFFYWILSIASHKGIKTRFRCTDFIQICKITKVRPLTMTVRMDLPACVTSTWHGPKDTWDHKLGCTGGGNRSYCRTISRFSIGKHDTKTHGDQQYLCIDYNCKAIYFVERNKIVFAVEWREEGVRLSVNRELVFFAVLETKLKDGAVKSSTDNRVNVITILIPTRSYQSDLCKNIRGQTQRIIL